jgi:hypothetical protein
LIICTLDFRLVKLGTKFTVALSIFAGVFPTCSTKIIATLMLIKRLLCRLAEIFTIAVRTNTLILRLLSVALRVTDVARILSTLFIRLCMAWTGTRMNLPTCRVMVGVQTTIGVKTFVKAIAMVGVTDTDVVSICLIAPMKCMVAVSAIGVEVNVCEIPFVTVVVRKTPTLIYFPMERRKVEVSATLVVMIFA